VEWRPRCQDHVRRGCGSCWVDPDRGGLDGGGATGHASGNPTRHWRAVINVFGYAELIHAYLFANKRTNRMKVLVHDGFACGCVRVF